MGMNADLKEIGQTGQDGNAAAIAGKLPLRAPCAGVRQMTDISANGLDPAALSGCVVAIAERRDKEAFKILFAHFAPRVKAYLLKNGAPPTTAEDLAQETMVAVWRKAALYDPSKATAATWIFTIARNQRIDAIRREKRPEIDPNDPALSIDPAPQADDALGQARRRPG